MNDRIQLLDGLPVRLREPHDFSFLQAYGTVFRVFDSNDSGNISFGMVDATGKRRFVKYAGARTVHYHGVARDAVERLQAAVPVYEDLRHPTLIRLTDHGAVGPGYAAVFDWVEGECLHAHWDFDRFPKYAHPQSPAVRFRKLGLAEKRAALAAVFAFHEQVNARGYVAIDFYDGSVLYDFETGRTTVCDIDFYRRAPVINTMGRMWGSSRFRSPEESTLGAAIDGTTNVFAMGALAFETFGSNSDRSQALWEGPAAAYAVAARATSPDRSERYPDIAGFIQDWNDAF